MFPRTRRFPPPFGATLLVLALAAGFTGCATPSKTYTVSVDAVSHPTAVTGWSYALAAGSPGSGRVDPHQGEIARRVHVALSQRGMYEAMNPADADFVIDFSYGERSPQARVTTSSQPVMVQPDPLAVGGPVVGGSQYPGSSPYGTSRPQVVMVQTTEVVRTSEKYFHISARENPTAKVPGAGPPAEVWRVEATIDDETTDVQQSIPALIDAVIEYMGYHTGGPQRVVVKLGT